MTDVAEVATVCVPSTLAGAANLYVREMAEETRNVNGRAAVRFILDRDRYAALKRYCELRDTYPTALIEAIGQCWLDVEEGREGMPADLEGRILEVAREIGRVNRSRKPKPKSN